MNNEEKNFIKEKFNINLRLKLSCQMKILKKLQNYTLFKPKIIKRVNLLSSKVVQNKVMKLLIRSPTWVKVKVFWIVDLLSQIECNGVKSPTHIQILKSKLKSKIHSKIPRMVISKSIKKYDRNVSV